MDEPENALVLLRNKYGVMVRSRGDKNNFDLLLDTLVKKKIMYNFYDVSNHILSFRGINFNEKDYINDLNRQYLESKKEEENNQRIFEI